MAFRTLLILLGLSILLSLSGCATRQVKPLLTETTQGDLKQTYYQMRMTTDDGITLSFTVYQPALKAGATAPLILHTHGFGLSRMKRPYLSLYGSIMPTGIGAKDAWKRGYWVISFDQRGHGGHDGTGGKIRLTDPEFEARDVSRIIDWAEQNLPQLARHAHGARVGMIGESYGGAVQYIAAAQDKRIAAIIPVTTWYNLEYSLAPNGVPKSGWINLLNVLGDWVNWNKFDPAVRQAYQESKQGHISAKTYSFLNTHQLRWFCDQRQTPKADALIIQGFRDVLFPFNEGVNAYQCLKNAGQDVRLIGMEGGHLQPGVQRAPGLDMPGWYIGKTIRCQNKTYNTQTMIATWFDSKLKDQTQGLAAIPEVCIDHSAASTIQALQPSVSYALPPIQATAGGGLEWLFKPADRLRHALTQQLPAQWQQPQQGGTRPLLVPLTRITTSHTLTGIPRLHINIEPQQVTPNQSLPILFVSLARWTPGQGSYHILNDQVIPVNMGAMQYRRDMLKQLNIPADDPAQGIEMPAVNAPLKAGDVVGLVISSHSRYYTRSSKSQVMANIGGSIELPALLPVQATMSTAMSTTTLAP